MRKCHNLALVRANRVVGGLELGPFADSKESSISGKLLLPISQMQTLHDSQNLFLEGPAGRLEAILWTPSRADSPLLATVVCHPHPLFGGTMHNKVVYNAAKTLDAMGIPVLRFNFRGAGLSAGEHDKGP